MTHPEIEAVVPLIVKAAHMHLRDELNQIVLHGSAVDGYFRSGDSDIDITILLHETTEATIDGSEARWRAQFDAITAIEELTGPWSRMDVAVYTRSTIEKYRNFELCYEGRVCRGVVIFDSGESFAGEVLSREEAKNRMAWKYIRQAWKWAVSASTSSNRMSWSCSRAACRALHAVLIANEFDVAPKSIRWNLNALLEAALQFSPELVDMDKWISRLEPDIAKIEIWNIDELTIGTIEDEYGVPDTARRKIIAAAMKCVRRCERVVGLKGYNPSAHGSRW